MSGPPALSLGVGKVGKQVGYTLVGILIGFALGLLLLALSSPAYSKEDFLKFFWGNFLALLGTGGLLFGGWQVWEASREARGFVHQLREELRDEKWVTIATGPAPVEFLKLFAGLLGLLDPKTKGVPAMVVGFALVLLGLWVLGLIA